MINDLTVEEAIAQSLHEELGQDSTSEVLHWPVFTTLKEKIRELECEQEDGKPEMDMPKFFLNMIYFMLRWTPIRPKSSRKLNEFLSSYESVFTNEWVLANGSNRIGRLVFMGAPFLSKVWMRGKWWAPGSVIGHIIDLIASVFLGLFAGYVLIEGSWVFYVWGGGSLIRLIWPFDADLTPVLDPRDWATWLQWTSGFFWATYALLGFTLFEGWKRHDINPYFDDKGLTEKHLEQLKGILPFDTLIVHAGLLDEVFLGFSAEPLVYGTLMPQVRSFLYPPLTLSVEDLPLGINPAPRNFVTRWGSTFLQVLLAFIVRIAWPFVKLWERVLTNQLLQLVSSPSFGMPAREFSRAVIVARKSIEYPDFFNETEWEVSRMLINSAPPKKVSDHEGSKRYSFLWDRDKRERLKNNSWLWNEVEESLPGIERRYRSIPSIDRDAVKQRLLNTCLVLEERMREVVGAVELVHSAYYSNPIIIEGVAQFIATGQLEAPSGATHAEMEGIGVNIDAC